MAKAHVCLCFAKHAIHHLGSSQSCHLVKSVKFNVFKKEKKRFVSLFFVKAKTKEREESIYPVAVNRQQIWFRTTNVLSTTKTNGYKKS